MANERETQTPEAMDAHDTESVAAEMHPGDDGHGLAHPPVTGRPFEHPPEPPHLIQILFQKVDQPSRVENSAAIQEWKETFKQQFIQQYTGEHGEAPSEKKVNDAIKEQLSHVTVENWLETDSSGEILMIDGEYVAKDGEGMTALQLLHVGPLKEKMPLIGYAPWENHVYFALAALVLVWIARMVTKGVRRVQNEAIRRPTRVQMATELFASAVDNMAIGLLGEKYGRRYVPFLGTLFAFILLMNLMGMVPLMKAPTSYVLLTLSLALCTFLVVQGTAWTTLGPASYVYHLMGQPKGLFGWFLGLFIFLPLEIISDFVAKPMSLGLRLFGNIFGKDVLLGVFTVMGVSIVAIVYEPLSKYFGIPLTPPFLVLGLLFSTLQALVFALLSGIYIALVLPHEHEDDDGDEMLAGPAAGEIVGANNDHQGHRPAAPAA